MGLTRRGRPGRDGQLLIFLLASLLCSPSLAQAPVVDVVAAIEAHDQAVFAAVAPSVAFIATDSGFGSGFFAVPGVLLTNAHVVGDQDRVDVVLHDGRRLEGRVVERAAVLDLALVKVSAADVEVLPLAPSAKPVSIGTWAAAVGHGRGGVWTYTTGLISNVYRDQGLTVYQTQIPLNPGASGGPVVDRLGRVIGVVTSGVRNSNSINYAVPIFEATRTLEGLAELCPCVEIRAPSGVPIFVDGKLVGTGPVVRTFLADGRHRVMAVVDGAPAERWIEVPGVRLVKLSD
ncbi:MAG: serine protease [Oligoflexia bacterium]|nr:serine protease [Oligoflexia bacterium]